MLIEFTGDHRSGSFPNVAKILQYKLKSRRKGVLRDFQKNLYNFDGFVSTWSYPNGDYVIANDTWGLFVHADENNESIMSDIEAALVSSDLFVKEHVDFNEYRE